MKSILLIGMLFNSPFALAASQGCGDLNDYTVQKVSFTESSLQTGLMALTNGMPFQIVMSGNNDIKVSAVDVSGPLGGVLDKFAKEAGFTYKQNKCMVEVAAITPPKPLPSWKLRAGRLIGSEIQEWALKEKCPVQGPLDTWKVVWHVPKDWDVAANATFTGDFKTAAGEVIKSLAENGALIRAEVRESNCTIVVTGPGILAK